MTKESISVERRRFLQLGTGVVLVGLAGCTGQRGGGSTGDDEMDGGMTESSMGSETDAEMDESSMDDGMESEMDDETESEMTESATQRFRIRLENVSTADTLRTMDGSAAVPLSPGVFVVHTEPGVLFTPGEPASDGLESIAEDGIPETLVASLGEMEMGDGMDGTTTGGGFDTPVGAASPGVLTPGAAYEFEVSGGHDARLSFATMFVQSNDLFYAPGPEGIPLFADGEPVEGDVTEQVQLWDAGTEVNEEPGTGPNQAPRQSGPDTGDDEMGTVQLVSAVDDGFDYPAVGEVLAVTVSPIE